MYNLASFLKKKASPISKEKHLLQKSSSEDINVSEELSSINGSYHWR